MHRLRSQPGFSLLELIIVLVVMVGLMAIVWPNLQRPLSRTSLDEAAQMVRSAIDESRYQATLAGTPWFVKLQIGAPAVTAGTFEAFIDASADPLESSTTAQSSTMATATTNNLTSTNRTGSSSSRTRSLRSWQLPDQVIIARVQWQLVGAVHRSTTSTGTLPLDSLDNNTGQDDLLSIDDELQSSSLATGEPTSPMVGDDSEVHWLPILASGRGRDATIVLWDQNTRQSIQVVFISATGAIEVLR